jgi:hypothetical protein
MKAWIPLMFTLALGSALYTHAAQATCAYPKAPDAPPDGNTATKDQMIAAKHDFDRYNSEMNAYLDCLKLEMDAAAPKDGAKLSSDEKKKADEQQKILAQKNNAAVDELQANVGRFNEQLKIYKAKNKP